ncbi:MAG: hypothetical protein GWP91_05915 [Rhodobacterales bacterium]|nr:hypothetical protein [Rhodobacterales bacterium]
MTFLLFVNMALANTCETWATGTSAPSVEDTAIEESSGVAASRLRPDVFYTHDDHGGTSVLHAFDLDGTFLGSHNVKGAQNEDWEDIAAAPCPDVGDCLYIADIGDNNADRGTVSVYIVREPEAQGKPAKRVEKRTGYYEAGPRDAEALMVHPCTGDIQLITKDGDGQSQVYQFIEGNPSKPLKLLASFNLDGLTSTTRAVTAADYNKTGDQLVVRTAGGIWIWQVDPNDPNAHWSDTPIAVDGVGLTDGEAITFDLDGDLVTTSEGSPMQVGIVECDVQIASNPVCNFPQTGAQCGCQSTTSTSGGLWLLALLSLARRNQLAKSPEINGIQ